MLNIINNHPFLFVICVFMVCCTIILSISMVCALLHKNHLKTIEYADARLTNTIGEQNEKNTSDININ